MQHWTALHVAWLERNDTRKAKVRAEYNAARDWKLVHSARSEESALRKQARELRRAARSRPLPLVTISEFEALFGHACATVDHGQDDQQLVGRV